MSAGVCRRATLSGAVQKLRLITAGAIQMHAPANPVRPAPKHPPPDRAKCPRETVWQVRKPAPAAQCVTLVLRPIGNHIGDAFLRCAIIKQPDPEGRKRA